MQMRSFGQQGFEVSAVGFGAGHIGNDDYSDDDAGKILNAALDLGITFVDTARGYGESEERIGRHLKARRNEIILSTKVGYDIPGTQDWTAQAVSDGITRALTLLRTDRIDVVFLHSCELAILQRGEVIEALASAQQQGKVRVIGYSGENKALAWAVDSGLFGAVQTSVNIADQWSLQRVLGRAESAGLGVVAKRPLANAPWRFVERPVGDYAETYWDRLAELGLEPGAGGWLDTALRFSAFAPGASTAIVGTGSVAHLNDAVEQAARGPLPVAEFDRWTEAFSPHTDEWPGSV